MFPGTNKFISTCGLFVLMQNVQLSNAKNCYQLNTRTIMELELDTWN